MPLRLLASLWISLFILNPLAANNKFGYNEEHPLVIVSDWDFHPFEFIDAEGRPSGYNVEVLDIIFNQLGIPHKFVYAAADDAEQETRSPGTAARASSSGS